MTTQHANTEGQEDLSGLDMDTEEGRTPTENILTGQEGDEAVDSDDVTSAMEAGWKKVSGTPKTDTEDEELDVTHLAGNQPGAEGDDPTRDDGDGTGKPAATTADDDPEIPGLGLKASEVKAQLARVAILEKSLASTSGHLGHLKQLVQQAGQGKKVTAESLKKVSEEFGPEFASALADDLNEAGFGAGAAVDTASIEQMVSEKIAEGRVATEREFEKKLVLRAHPDADDHFAHIKTDAAGNPVTQKDKDGNEVPVWQPGPKHAAFIAFVQTLPKERQAELFGAKGWDSSVVTKALDDFKAHEKKAANTQATQTQRMQRAAAPKAGGSRDVQPPATDPLMQGWNKVRGNRAATPASAGARRR